MVAFSPYASAIHCDTIGFMMMIGGLVVVAAGAMAMFSACYEKPWGAKIVKHKFKWLTKINNLFLGSRINGNRIMYVYRCSRICFKCPV